jgi:Siphovirus ReqiPepy6 Gp37-like protein
MDLIKFDYVGGVPDLTKGISVADTTKSKLWVERYRDAGEFEIVAEPQSGLRTSMPIGACVSHIDTDEIMVVENHIISENAEGESELTVSGRSLETVLEQRVVGQNQNWTNSGTYYYPTTVGSELTRLYLAAGYTYAQAVQLINGHVLTGTVINANDAVPILQAYTALADVVTSEERDFDREEVYAQLVDLLAIDDLGIKVVRPGQRNPLTNPNNLTKAALVIHKGTNLSSSVTFSHDNGDIESAEYLWSNKGNKTSALVKGKWLEIMVHGTETGYARRVVTVDASFIDDLPAMPAAGAARNAVYARMYTYGKAVLARMNDVSITKVEISDQKDRWTYRKDFNIGDIIAVQGNYNATANMRVTEYVEMEDESGAKSYPTLSFL